MGAESEKAMKQKTLVIVLSVTFVGLSAACAYWALVNPSGNDIVVIPRIDPEGYRTDPRYPIAGKSISGIRVEQHRLVILTTAGRYPIGGRDMRFEYHEDVTPRTSVTIRWLEQSHTLDGDVSSIRVTANEITLLTTKSKLVILTRTPDQYGTLTIK